jgi:hypothetical protein
MELYNAQLWSQCLRTKLHGAVSQQQPPARDLTDNDAPGMVQNVTVPDLHDDACASSVRCVEVSGCVVIDIKGNGQALLWVASAASTCCAGNRGGPDHLASTRGWRSHTQCRACGLPDQTWRSRVCPLPKGDHTYRRCTGKHANTSPASSTDTSDALTAGGTCYDCAHPQIGQGAIIARIRRYTRAC